MLGGARSGKSGHAESLAVLEPVRYLATGRRDATDEDWQLRIERHRASRPRHWSTVETVTSLSGVVTQPWDGTTVVDDLGTWLTGMLDDAQAWELPAARSHRLSTIWFEQSRTAHPTLCSSAPKSACPWCRSPVPVASSETSWDCSILGSRQYVTGFCWSSQDSR